MVNVWRVRPALHTANGSACLVVALRMRSREIYDRGGRTSVHIACVMCPAPGAGVPGASVLCVPALERPSLRCSDTMRYSAVSLGQVVIVKRDEKLIARVQRSHPESRPLPTAPRWKIEVHTATV